MEGYWARERELGVLRLARGGPGLAAEERVTLVGRVGEREREGEGEPHGCHAPPWTWPAMLMEWRQVAVQGGRVGRRGEKGSSPQVFYHEFAPVLERAELCP